MDTGSSELPEKKMHVNSHANSSQDNPERRVEEAAGMVEGWKCNRPPMGTIFDSNASCSSPATTCFRDDHR